MQKGFVEIAVIIIVLILSAAGAAYYFGFDHGWEKSVKNTPTATSPSPVTDETVNWKTYTTSEFSIKYPPEMTPPASSYQGGYTFELWGPTQKAQTEFYDGINITITPGSLSGQDLKDLATRDQDASKENLGAESVSSLSATNTGGYQGYKYTSSGLGKMKYIYLSNNANKYAVIRNLLNTDPQNKGFQKTADLILSTFKFTN